MAFTAFRQRDIAVGVSTLLLAIAILSAGLWSAVHLSAAFRRADRSSQLARAHLDASTMCGALRVDVLIALSAKDPAPRQVEAELSRHARALREDHAESLRLAVDPADRAALGALEAPVDAYIAAAESLATQAARDPGAAQAGLPRFLALSRRLEGEMDRADDQIARSGGSAEAAARQASAAAQALMGFVLAASAMLVAAVAMTVRRVSAASLRTAA